MPPHSAAPFLVRGSLYAITPGWSNREKIAAVVKPLILAGLPALQLREPNLLERVMVDLLVELNDLVICNALQCKIILNNNIRIVERYNREFGGSYGMVGLHLKDGSISPQQARSEVGPEIIVGISSHRDWERQTAWLSHASYRSLSPIFPSTSKPNEPPLGLAELKRCCEESPIPVYALGGALPDLVKGCLDSGATGIAAIGAVMGAKDPVLALQQLVTASTQALAQSQPIA